METEAQKTQDSAKQNNNTRGLVLIIALFLLSAGIAYNLLAHCAFGFPRFISGQPLVDYCGIYEANIDTQLDQADELANNLLSQPETEPEAETTETPSSTEIEERLVDEDATLGALSVTLAWSSRDDLDLHIKCPSGKIIYFGDKEGCGAKLEVDKNVDSNIENRPIEHITWRHQMQAPPGLYEIYVSRHTKRTALSSTPFVVELRTGETVIQRFTGAASDATYLASFELPLDE